MRTTLDIDPDILETAKEMAGKTKKSAGQVLSDLARIALTSSSLSAHPDHALVNGFEVIPAGQRRVTPEFIRKLMDESDKP